MGGKQNRVRHAFKDGGRLSTAFRRIVAKMPSRLTRDGSLNLCQRCKELDLDYIFNGPYSSFSGSKMVVSLGILDENSPCALCRFFYSMRRPSLIGKTTDIYHLRKYAFERDSGTLKSPEPDFSTVWAVDPGSGSQGRHFWMNGLSYQRMMDRPQLLFLPKSTERCPYQEKTLEGLPISETSVNYSLLRHWIKECDGHPDCSYLSTDSTNPRTGSVIRGIDCVTRNIVDLQPGDKYIALSYVWGNKPLVENKGSRVLPTNAPKVIEDAMVAVKELGQQYLWVDQYCINQHDDQDKHAQIKNMDRIYEGSYATIVAYSGVDSSCGLPGVSGTPRMPQHRFASSKTTLLGFTPFTTRQSSEASIWMKRGWTFQEALLSRRLLIFTQEQVYFLCSNGWWAESCTPRRRMLGGDGNHKEFSSNLARAPMIPVAPLIRMPVYRSVFQVRVDLSRLLDLIGEFTRRQLSFQSDALDAVRGLLSRVPILTYWGVPVYDYLEKRTFAFDALKANKVFLRSLFWQPDGTASDAEVLGRREGFPSWSWLGWRTPVTFKLFYDDDSPRSIVEVENTDGTLLSFSDLVELSGAEMKRSRVLPERTTYLWLEGLVLTLGFQPVGNRHGGDISFCFNHPLGYSDYPCLMEGSCSPKRGVWTEVNFRFNVKGSEDIYKRTLKKKWTCLFIMAACSFRTMTHHFLVLDEGDDAAYCVGTLCLEDSTRAVDGGMLENLKAKILHEYRKVRIG